MGKLSTPPYPVTTTTTACPVPRSTKYLYVLQMIVRVRYDTVQHGTAETQYLRYSRMLSVSQVFPGVPCDTRCCQCPGKYVVIIIATVEREVAMVLNVAPCVAKCVLLSAWLRADENEGSDDAKTHSLSDLFYLKYIIANVFRSYPSPFMSWCTYPA